MVQTVLIHKKCLVTVQGEWRTSSAAEETGNVRRLQSLAIGATKLFLVFAAVCVHYLLDHIIIILARCKASFASAVHATANPYVRLSLCLSVRPSHSFIVSKRGNAEGCGLYRRVVRCV